MEFNFTTSATSITVPFLHPYYTYACVICTYTVAAGPYAEVTVMTAEDGMLHKLAQVYRNVMVLYLYFLLFFSSKNLIMKDIYFFHYPVPSGSPQNTTATDISSRSATLTWSPPLPEDRNGNITAYVINASVVGSEEMFQLVSESTILEIDTMTPYTTYSFLIAASTVVGLGPYSTVLTVQTPEDG